MSSTLHKSSCLLLVICAVQAVPMLLLLLLPLQGVLIPCEMQTQSCLAHGSTLHSGIHTCCWGWMQHAGPLLCHRHAGCHHLLLRPEGRGFYGSLCC